MKNRIFSTLFLVLLCIVIFYFSNQPGEISLQVSDRVATSIHIEKNEFWETPSQKYLIGIFSFRKIAHVLIFYLLGILASIRFRETKRISMILKASIFCAVFSIFDECHQGFINGRTASVLDLFIDAIGYCLAIGMAVFISLLFKMSASSANSGRTVR